MYTIFLLGSILFTSYLTLAFKVCEKYRIDIFQAIVFNYITCVVTGSFVNGAFPVNAGSLNNSWFQWGLVMGLFFIGLFNLISVTVINDGVAVATVSNKLSLVIPVVLAVYLYGEKVAGFKLVGIIAALVAVVLTCYRSEKNRFAGAVSEKRFSYFLPLVLFIGSGILDSIINHVQKKYVTGENHNAFLITGFFSAAAVGTIILVAQYVRNKRIFAGRHLLAGIIIGVPNYFSIWCMMKFLKTSPMQSSANIPVNNMGIVLFSSVMAWVLFKEKLSFINWTGILLSIAAIALIAFG